MIEILIVFFSQVIFCVFKTLIIYTTMNGEKTKTAGIAVVLGVLNLGIVFLGIKAIETGNLPIIAAYLAGNFVGTYFSTKEKADDNSADEPNGTEENRNRPPKRVGVDNSRRRTATLGAHVGRRRRL